MYKRILVPLDGSDRAEQALETAAELALKFGAEVLLLRALTLSLQAFVAAPGIPVPVYQGEMLDAERAEIEKYLAHQAEALRSRGVTVSLVVGEDVAAAAILDAAEDARADLIVMSTHGRTGLARWTYGSVAEKVLRHAPCPVLVVRPQ